MKYSIVMVIVELILGHYSQLKLVLVILEMLIHFGSSHKNIGSHELETTPNANSNWIRCCHQFYILLIKKVENVVIVIVVIEISYFIIGHFLDLLTFLCSHIACIDLHCTCYSCSRTFTNFPQAFLNFIFDYKNYEKLMKFGY